MYPLSPLGIKNGYEFLMYFILNEKSPHFGIKKIKFKGQIQYQNARIEMFNSSLMRNLHKCTRNL
jgi:hypothetical protein